MSSSENFFTDTTALKTVDRWRVIYLWVSVLAFLLTEVGRSVYRPYVYKHGIHDFGLADSMGNLGGIVVQIFVMLAALNSPPKKVLHVIGFVTIGYMVYEFIQPYLPKGVFDWLDIYGTLLGGLISGLIWLLIKRFVVNKTIHTF